VCNVIDVRELNPDEDRALHRWSGFHESRR
jgi:hypothetical protein